MRAAIRLTIDLEARTKRRLLFFWHRMYAKATFEGEMEVGEIRIGETLPLHIYNDVIATPLVVRSIQSIPTPGSSEVKALIQMYDRTTSAVLTHEGGLRNHTIQECVDRLNNSIARRLSQYGLILHPDKSRVGPEPTYGHIPSDMGSTELAQALYAFHY